MSTFKTLYEHVAEAAYQNPSGIALIEELQGKKYTYQQLMNDVEKVSLVIRRIAAFKQAYNDPSGETPLVSTIFDRSYWCIVSILAILKSGGAYVPIDPSFPEDRQAHIMTHSQCKIAIVEHTYITKLQELKNKSEGGAVDGGALPDLLVVHGITGELTYSPEILTADGSLTSQPPCKTDQSLAYVLYTSGSTGKPKGVMVRDISVVNIISFFANQLSVTKEDKILGLTTFCFDISVLEIFVPLFRSATFVLVSSATQKNPFKIIQTLATYQVSIMQATPTTYEMMLGCNNWKGHSQLR